VLDASLIHAAGAVGASAEAGPYARVERFPSVGSTNDVVRDWLAAGIPEVCVAVADEQVAGRGRHGRRWVAPPGMALMGSLGFRPTWLAAEDAWRLSAIVALAAADAAEDAAGLAEGTIRLKWPNDLVVVHGGPDGVIVGDAGAAEARATRSEPGSLRKLAGILGESSGLGGGDPRVVIGVGLNAGWPAAEFPPELAASMTSLHAISGGRPIDREALLDGFLGRLETRIAALRGGRFDVAGWTARQATTGHLVTIAGIDGSRTVARALGVDGASGALVVDGPPSRTAAAGPTAGPAGERFVHAGEVLHVRLDPMGGV
jgi:BirA family biotin operon repressor/biotin-[acetyl-CoA-carboxylase] ligase